MYCCIESIGGGGMSFKTDLSDGVSAAPLMTVFLSLFSPVSGDWSALHKPCLILHFALRIFFCPSTAWSLLHYWTAPCLDKVIPTQTFSDSHLKISLLTSLLWLPLNGLLSPCPDSFSSPIFTPIFIFGSLRFLPCSTIFWFLAPCLCILILCVIFH